MQNKILLSLVAVALLVSCSNDSVSNQADGREVETTITLVAPNAIETRTGILPDEYTDPALTRVNVTLFVSYKGKIVKTILKTAQDLSGGKTVEFKTRLVTGQTYDISAWADFGQGFYTLHTTVGDAPYVDLSSTAIKTLTTNVAYNLYDAYYGNVSKKINSTETLTLTLKRPFALVKISTTDWNQEGVKEAGIRPTNYATSFYVPTRMQLIDGALSKQRNVTVEAYVSQYDKDAILKELSFDYLFADSISSILNDFTVIYKQGAEVITDYTFQNIPVQRNYKTIIMGNVLTKEGTILVAVDSVWNKPSHDVIY